MILAAVMLTAGLNAIDVRFPVALALRVGADDVLVNIVAVLVDIITDVKGTAITMAGILAIDDRFPVALALRVGADDVLVDIVAVLVDIITLGAAERRRRAGA